MRQQIRGATLDLAEQTAEYPECLRLELDYLLVHKIRGIEVPGSGLERTYNGYHRVDRYSRYFTFVEVEADGKRYPLIDAQHPYRYAAGYDFTWGYAGAGPSRLAVSILADATDGDIELARRLREDFLKEKLINLPQNKDISIPHREVLEWMRTKGPTGEEIRRASQGVRQRLQQFFPDIKNLSDRLEVIHENGPLRSQRFDVVPRDFECALYVDLVQMLQKNVFCCTAMGVHSQSVAPILREVIGSGDSSLLAGLFIIRSALGRRLCNESARTRGGAARTIDSGSRSGSMPAGDASSGELEGVFDGDTSNKLDTWQMRT